MQTEQQQRAGEFIWQLWQAGKLAPDLPADLKPGTRAAGYAIQAHLDGRSKKPRFGWKIAATSTAGQQHIGVSGPMAGRINAEQVLPLGATISLATNLLRVAEPEFAFRMAHDLPPRDKPYALAEVMAAVADLHLAIEIPDTRFSDFVNVGEAALIADDACARELVVGPAVNTDWRALDLSRHAVEATIADRGTRAGIGSNVLGDPRAALTWIANELSGLGLGLAAGETVTTGTCMVPIAIQPGDHIDVDFGALGMIAVRFD